jgi:hypothetical protein
MTEATPDLFKVLIRKVAQDCKAYLSSPTIMAL